MPDGETTRERIDGDLFAVDASPTKAFFVYIITRDIQLDRAIADLVDNSVDGAKRLRPGEAANYTGLHINLTVRRDHFAIEDNCGGIAFHTAKYYAFKFGRPSDFRPTDYSVGQFGVGMKRALFKIGRNFSVRTTEPNAHFGISVDVDQWLRNNEVWDFRVEPDAILDTPQPQEAWGTTLEVTNLNDSSAQYFGEEYFIDALRKQIQILQQQFMRQGLAISFNGEAIIPIEWQLKGGGGIGSTYIRHVDEAPGCAPIVSRIYAGVGDSSRSAAGWYVFCNGRCIVEADQTPITGWGDTGEPGTELPKYHGQFARFRGYAFLDCSDAGRLPWNTTKTALDQDSPAYRKLRGRLIDATRPVIDFLNRLDSEKDVVPAERELTRAIERATNIPLERVTERATFEYTAPAARGPALARISYQKPAADVDLLKETLGASSNRHLGELTFDHAFDNFVEQE